MRPFFVTSWCYLAIWEMAKKYEIFIDSEIERWMNELDWQIYTQLGIIALL